MKVGIVLAFIVGLVLGLLMINSPNTTTNNQTTTTTTTTTTTKATDLPVSCFGLPAKQKNSLNTRPRGIAA